MNLLPVDGNNGKRVRDSEDVALDQRVGSDDCSTEENGLKMVVRQAATEMEMARKVESRKMTW